MCDDRITEILEQILACVEEKIVECGATPFCRSGLVGGTVAWDDCCDCGSGEGQLWVRLVDWQPDDAFPALTPSDCHLPSILTIGVGALRCVPTLDEAGNAPSAAAESAAAAKIHHDAQLIFEAVQCCPELEERTWQGWLPLGYEGGCGGGEAVWTVPYHPCTCGESPTSP